MDGIDKICSNVREDIRPQVKTLAKAVVALQTKIEDELPAYETAELTQELITRQGDIAIKINPEVQEFRAIVRDYATAIKSLQDIIEQNQSQENVSSLKDLRNKLKVAK